MSTFRHRFHCLCFMWDLAKSIGQLRNFGIGSEVLKVVGSYLELRILFLSSSLLLGGLRWKRPCLISPPPSTSCASFPCVVIARLNFFFIIYQYSMQADLVGQLWLVFFGGGCRFDSGWSSGLFCERKESPIMSKIGYQTTLKSNFKKF